MYNGRFKLATLEPVLQTLAGSLLMMMPEKFLYSRFGRYCLMARFHRLLCKAVATIRYGLTADPWVLNPASST